jgi:hypothetical protein
LEDLLKMRRMRSKRALKDWLILISLEDLCGRNRERLGKQAGSEELGFRGLEPRSKGGVVVTEEEVFLTADTRKVKGADVRSDWTKTKR